MSQPLVTKSSTRAKASPRLIPIHSKPPEVNRLEHKIRVKHGSTSILDLSPHRIQLAKLNPAPDLSARIVELTKEMGCLRQEVQFYRQCFETLQRLRETVYDVYQQLFLANYFDRDFARLEELTNQLHRGLQDSVKREVKAEKAWMEFWGIDHDDQEMEGELI